MSSTSGPKSGPKGGSSKGSTYRKRLQDYAILMEYNAMRDRVVSSLYVIPQFGNLRRWHGVIFVRSGHYAGGTFKFIVTLPEGYPTSGVPTVRFLTSLYHPMVDPSKQTLDLSPAPIRFNRGPATEGGDAKAAREAAVPGRGYMLKLMTYIKEVFYYHEKFWLGGDGRRPGRAANRKAASLWRKSKDKFQAECNKSVKESIKFLTVNAPDAPLRISTKRDDKFEMIRREILKTSRREPPPGGFLEWFGPGVRGKNIPNKSFKI